MEETVPIITTALAPSNGKENSVKQVQIANSHFILFALSQ